MEKINYVNVDLEIKSNENLSPIIDEFGNDISVLYNEYDELNNTYLICVESNFDYKFNNPDELINFFCMNIEGFSPKTKKLWSNCNQRIFDIGYRCIPNSIIHESEISFLTIKKISDLGASLKITIYPADKP